MKKTLVLIITLLGFAACEAQPPTQPKPPEAQTTSPTKSPQQTKPSKPQGTPTTQPSTHASTNANCNALSELDQMDPRTPVPLQPMMAWHQKQNMQEHLKAIEGIIDALAREDWVALKKHSATIETNPQMTQMCQHMGAGAKGFTEMALSFHKTADEIGRAASAKDQKAVLRAMAKTINVCTSCHTTYKQQVVDAATWQKKTGQHHQPTKHH